MITMIFVFVCISVCVPENVYIYIFMEMLPIESHLGKTRGFWAGKWKFGDLGL